MPAKINSNLIPAVIRESVDPDILSRAASIEWTISRDTGDEERGYLDKSRGFRRSQSALNNNKTSNRSKSVQWLDESSERCDSGFQNTPTSSTNASPTQLNDEHNSEYNAQQQATTTATRGSTPPSSIVGNIKKHAFVDTNKQPFPIYKVNKEQLAGVDIIFEVNNKQQGEPCVHYEKASKIVNEKELRALGFDVKYFSPNSTCTLDECEEETLETSELSGNSRELKQLYKAMSTDTFGYLDDDDDDDNVLPIRNSSSLKNIISYKSVEELNNVNNNQVEEYKSKFLSNNNNNNDDDYDIDDTDRQWELKDGQWVRVGAADEEASAEDSNFEPETERYTAERVKCTILLEPIPPPIKEVKLKPAKPIRVVMKEPLKIKNEEDKEMENPDLMWMKMGPTQYGPPFGTLGRRKAREEEWIGPPCELCHKQIKERRCMLAENRKFHCWHFSCSFCLKTLKPADFLIAKSDNQPYCLNCHKREFPQISLVNLKLSDESNVALKNDNQATIVKAC